MTMLLAQIFLLMLTAFLLGAMLGCLLKHLIYGTGEETRPASDVVQEPAVAAQAPGPSVAKPAGETGRFERALAGPGNVPQPAPQPSRPAVPVVEVQPPAPKPAPVPAPVAAPAAPKPAPQPAPAPAPVVAAPAAPAPQPAPKPAPPAPAPAPATTAPLAPKPAVQAPAAPAPQPAPVPAAGPPPAAPVAPKPAAPVSAPAQPAPAAPAQPVAAAAAMAAAAAAAAAAKPAAAAPAAPPANQPAPVPAAPTPPFGTVVKSTAEVKDLTPKPAPAAGPADDLTRIRAIDTALQSRLNGLNVRRFEEIANWTPADVTRFSQALGFFGRIEQENWIEQAQILARGMETDYSRKRALAAQEAAKAAAAAAKPAAPAVAPAAAPAPAAAQPAAAPPAAAKPAAPAPAPAAGPAPAPAPAQKLATDAAAAAAAAVAAATAVANRVAAQAGAPDRLHRIIGLNAEAEKILNQNGVTRFGQIAAWMPADTEKFDRLLGGRAGRIAEENWIEQARVLAGGGEAETPRPVKLADAIRDNQRGDLAGLRSVRSEALRGDPGTRGSGTPDDLKRIRGIGVLIEKKLNSLGITAYEQVANWSGADIDRISQILDFKGRIERENWIEQARILASGGQTEFSRRVDRGEVDSSR